MTYGFETWPLTTGLIRRLKVTQRSIKIAMLGISLRVHKADITRVTNIAQRVATLCGRAKGNSGKSGDGRGIKLGEWMDVGVPRCWNGSPALVSAV
ncbi:jg6983 [Pararge aegeria aegeria]|uniref:Jg6983 protein n=1 Tax=Pararge aegeria aegeria TaxID=348720 RepID=A0A8S4SE63_9NEOP|nr:jg6983 [Pararge aegeria aegeria]